jgi:hypothetical protein
LPTEEQNHAAINTKVPGMVRASQGENYPAHTTSSTPPDWAKSVLADPNDQRMASRQTRYSSMAPAEQRAQNAWAQGIIMGTGVCPQDFGWQRVEPHGYQCLGKHHLITDELLAQGRGGLWLVPAGKACKMDVRWGPYYPDPEKGKRLKFGGDPKNDGPAWTDVEIQAWHWPKAWRLVPETKGPPGNEEDYKILEQAFSRIWLRPILIHSKSSGATLYIRKGDKDSESGSGLMGSISSSSNRSGSRTSDSQPASSSHQQSNSGSERPSPVSRHSSSRVAGLNDPKSPSVSRHNSNIGSECPTVVSRHSSSSGSERRSIISGHSKKPGSEFFTAGPSHISRKLHGLRNPSGHPSKSARHSRREHGSDSPSE